MDIKETRITTNIMALKGTAVGSFIIPIVFSFVFGGIVLSLALGQADISHPVSSPRQSLQFVGVASEYAISEIISASVSVSDPAYDCGDLYITIFDVSGSQKMAVTQGAFFDQCYGQSGVLPLNESFAEIMPSAGRYQIEAQLFDNQGNKFLSATHIFTVR
ncbi:MAG: hypothetical protein QXW91_02660 [Candidatus Nitrosotenuis sp.]